MIEFSSDLVSIITPNFNSEKFIAKTIESVLSQTYQNWEMLIVDDCSTDNSYEIALDFAKKDTRIKIFQNTINSGAAVSRNLAIENSRGEYLAFLDSDDLWLPEKLEKQLTFMNETGADFSFTEYQHMDENGKLLKVKAKIINKLTYNKMLFHCWPGCLTVVYAQNINKKIYGPDIKRNNDHALFLKVLKKSKNARGLNSNLGMYRIRQGSISQNKYKIIKYYIEVLHIHEEKNLFFSWFCVFTHVFIKTFFKYKRVKINENSRIIF